MIDPGRNGQLIAPDVDNHLQLAVDLTEAFGKIRPGAYAVVRGGLIEVHDDTVTPQGVILARLFPSEAKASLHLLELLMAIIPVPPHVSTY